MLKIDEELSWRYIFTFELEILSWLWYLQCLAVVPCNFWFLPYLITFIEFWNKTFIQSMVVDCSYSAFHAVGRYLISVNDLQYTFYLLFNLCFFFFTETVYSFSALADSWIELTTARKQICLTNPLWHIYIHAILEP